MSIGDMAYKKMTFSPMFLVVLVLATCVSAFGRPSEPQSINNACAFTWKSDVVVEEDLASTAIAEAIKVITDIDHNLKFQAADNQFAAIFSGTDAEASAKSFCESLPTSVGHYLAKFMPELGQVTVTDAVLGVAPGKSPRGCYVYGYNLPACGWGSPMFGCSETRDCYKYKRGRCAAYRRVCRCGGSFFGGC